MVLSKLVWTCVLLTGAHAFIVVDNNRHSTRSGEQLQSHHDPVAGMDENVDPAPRRQAFQTVVAAVSGGLLSTLVAPSQPALASGGATAGKYT